MKPDLPIFKTIAELRADGKTPSEIIDALTEKEFLEAEAAAEHLNKRLQGCIKTRRKGMDRVVKAQEKWNEFRGFVHSKVKEGGAWIHAIAKEGKEWYGENYSTKGRVEEAARSFDDLTLRQQPYGDDISDTALAVFKGKPVPQVLHVDQSLL